MKNIKYVASVFFIFMMMVLLSTCRHSLHPLAQLSLPQWPPSTQNIHQWPKLEAWQVQITTPQFSSSYRISPATRTITVEAETNTPISLQVYPVTEGVIFFHPAGAILPWNGHITWLNGFTAELLKKLYLSTREQNHQEDIQTFASSFNWNRMETQLKEKSTDQGNLYNPWLLDQEQIISKICSKTFTATSLNVKKTKEIQLSQQYTARYVPQNQNNEENRFILQENKLEKFLYLDQEYYIATATINSKSSLSLAINSLPL